MGTFDIPDVFAPGGVLSQSLRGFESRPQQAEMAGAVRAVLAEGGHLVIEAGTGVGKSFAYLVPAIEAVGLGEGKVLVSTYTITLQEQLINKDIPFLSGCLGIRFSAVLAKGRGNYLCKRRLAFAVGRQRLLFERFGGELARIQAWAVGTEDGSLSDLGFVPSGAVWDAVNSEHGNCRGRKCAHFQRCFYQRARRRAESADIVVANHALMFSDLVLKEQGGSVLPAYKHIIIDEAQNLEHVAEEHFGINISNRQLQFMLGRVYNPRTRRGLLWPYASSREAARAVDLVARIEKQAQAFFKRVRKWYEQSEGQTKGRCYANSIEDTLSSYIKDLGSELGRLARSGRDDDERLELQRFADRCRELARQFDFFFCQEGLEHVYWVEVSEGAKGTIRLRSAPVNVGPDVSKCLFERYDSVVLTSATLSSGSVSEPGGFDFFAGRIGLKDFEAMKLGSPYDYERNVTMYVEKGLPNPNDPGFVEAAVEAIKKYVLRTQGRAFVLFTSYRMLEAAAELLGGWCQANGIELLEQGKSYDRGTMIKRFKGHARDAERCVLFGTDSFWQGVDVQGEALSNVIIVRLPFAVPDKPLLAGRLEQIRREGGNPFMDYQLPSAIIKFKQGFGRLIRSKSDTGIVVVLDSRIVQKRYGQEFLAAVPKCRIELVD